ncbi:MAG: Ig-like domain-containing protein [Clostridia bacterium]|nr:Ig-like domain-containing protein [Clostridia bacterium]
MKAMKKLMIVAATLTLSSAAFYAAACGTDEAHEHDYKWTTTTSATCETDGLETGVCECGDTQTRPISALGHSYGDWFVNAPSREQKGKAVRICATDAEHKQEVSLPELPASGNGAYKSVTPVSGSDYAYTYVYDANGDDVFFTGYSFDKNSVSAAVSVAAESNSNAINSKAQHYTKNYGTGKTSNASVNLEFGDGYVHIIDNTQIQEMWYEKQPDGSSFNALKFVDRYGNQAIKLDERSDALQLYDGYSYGFVWVYSNHYDYGVGNFINYYYLQAQNNANGDFTESYKEVNGKTVYSFSYGVFDETYGQHLNVLSFEFTLASNGVVESLTAKNDTYINSPETTGTTADGDPVTYPAETNFTQDENGHWNLISNPVIAETESWTITQKTALEADETLPETPYHYKDMVATSYDLMRVTVTERQDGTVQIQNLGLLGDEYDLNATTAVSVQLQNVAPSTANFYVDDVKIYWRTVDEDGKNVDTLLQPSYAGNGSDWHIQASFDPVLNVLVINPYVAGDHTIVIKTANVEKIVTLHVPYNDPTGLTCSVYDYDVELDTPRWDTLNNYFRIYAGEALNFTSTVDHPAYQDASYTATVTGPSDVTLGTDMILGTEVSVFKADVTGLYTVTLTSTKSGSSSSFKVRVVAAPDEAKLLSGVYHGVDDNKNDVSVTFDTEGKTASIKIGENGSVYSANLGYIYTPATSDSAPILVVANDPTSDYEFTFEITSGYEVLLNYVDDFGENNRVYISNAVKNLITGTYTVTPNHNKHTANVSALYAVSSNVSFYYSFNGVIATDDTGAVKSQNRLTIELEEGDVIEIWTSNAKGGSYELTVYNPVTDVEIVEPASKEIFVGGKKLSLETLFTGQDSDKEPSFKTVTWTSSDTSIATVDSTGLVTGKAAGTVTITATSTDNPNATATIELTVTYINATSVTLNKTEAEMKVGGDTLELEATVGAANASNKNVIWTSSDESIATVSGTVNAQGKLIGVVTVNSNVSATTTVTITAMSVDSTDENPVLATCTITVKYIAPTSVTLNKTTADMVVGGSTLALTATVGPEDTSNKKVTWTSSDASIATVSANGVVTVNADLTADTTVTITAASAADGTVKATCVITVKYNSVTSVSLNTSTATLKVGASTTLTATVTGADGAAASNGKVTWTSSNPEVVSVNEDGAVAVNADYRTNGTQVTITATSVADNTKTATCVITVSYVPVATFELNSTTDTEYTLDIGASQNVGLNVKDASNTNNYTIKGITWTSDNEKVTVTSTNNTSATIAVSDELRESIVAHITATSADNPEKTVTITVTVNYVAVTGITLDKTTAEMTVGGDNLTLSATLSPDAPSVTQVTWSSSDSSVATVDATGVVRVKSGVNETKTVTIRATAVDNSDIYAECEITVIYVPVTSVTVESESIALKVGAKRPDEVYGEGASAKASVLPENASIKKLTYSSSDTSVATVDENGVITALKEGTATITVTSAADSTLKKTITVTVSAATVSEGTNNLSLASASTVVYVFTGKPNTPYTFTLNKSAWGYKVCKDEYVYSATNVLSGTTDANGKFNVAVCVPYEDGICSVVLTIAETVAKEDGTADFPYTVALGKTYSYKNVGCYGGLAGKLVIEEEGDYLLSGSSILLKIGTGEFGSYWSGGCTIYEDCEDVYAGGTIHLTAGTYNVAILGVDPSGWGDPTNVTFTLTKA